jgi:hypothetical protein
MRLDRNFEDWKWREGKGETQDLEFRASSLVLSFLRFLL